jgi:cytochrome c1
MKSNKIKQYADIYLLQSNSTCFGCHSTHHQEYNKTVTTASGVGHNILATSRPVAQKYVK